MVQIVIDISLIGLLKALSCVCFDLLLKDCRDDIENFEPEIVKALDCASEILHDPEVDDNQKDDIKAYISELEIQLKALHRQAVHDKHRLFAS